MWASPWCLATRILNKEVRAGVETGCSAWLPVLLNGRWKLELELELGLELEL